jgi:hypothetical protein
MVPDDEIELPRTGVTLEQARRQISGLHFSKETLSDHERALLYLTEGLLRLVDEMRQQ